METTVLNSDEGFIGPQTCAKLARDFAEHRNKAGAIFCGRSWELRLYDDWRRAFELAAGSGVVKLH